MKKLKIWHAFIAVALMILLSVSCNKDEEITLDFAITVPSTWDFYILGNQGTVYIAERAQLNAQDTIREYLDVYKEVLSASYTLSSYYSALRPMILASSNFISVLQEKDTAINGTDFKRIITNEWEQYHNSYYNDTIDISMINTRYFFFENNNGYYITLGSIDTSYYKNKPVFDEIMGSFQYKY